MKENSDILLEGHRIVLVPYKKGHVQRYHEWMQSPKMLSQTASEPLSLEQEYEMQISWYEDEDKCTFIVLDREKWQDPKNSEVDCMAGDVNLFFNDHDDVKTAEIEIMIAEPSCQGKGMGKEALLMMMNYGVSELGVKKFVAKISLNNTPSLSLFDKLAFQQVSCSDVFQEVTLELNITKHFLEYLKNANQHVRTAKYTNSKEVTT